MNDDIAKHLRIAPAIIEGELVSTNKPNVKADDLSEADRDFKYARDNFYSIIENGTRALEDLLDVATRSQHPRAYEVLATTMKTLIDANKDLVELSRKKQEAEEVKNPDQKNVTNNLFVGSTADLQQILKDMRNESD